MKDTAPPNVDRNYITLTQIVANLLFYYYSIPDKKSIQSIVSLHDHVRNWIIGTSQFQKNTDVTSLSNVKYNT